jgi:hypothetical protein
MSVCGDTYSFYEKPWVFIAKDRMLKTVVEDTFHRVIQPVN